MNSINFAVSVEEANLIIMALAKQPFETVVGIMNKLQKQAQEQMPQQVPPPPNAA